MGPGQGQFNSESQPMIRTCRALAVGAVAVTMPAAAATTSNNATIRLRMDDPPRQIQQRR
jgi:hypothetical protein